MEVKLVIGLKNGKCYPKTVDNTIFIDKKLGDKIDGKLIGLQNSEFEITGGSDSAGFPMRRDIHGIGRKKILTGNSIGVKDVRRGDIKRKTVSGRKISEKTAQINLKLLKGDVEKLLAPVVEETKEEVKEVK